MESDGFRDINCIHLNSLLQLLLFTLLEFFPCFIIFYIFSGSSVKGDNFYYYHCHLVDKLRRHINIV